MNSAAALILCGEGTAGDEVIDVGVSDSDDVDEEDEDTIAEEIVDESAAAFWFRELWR